MENSGFCNDNYNSGTSDDDMVDISGATLDFSDDVPQIEGDHFGAGKTATTPQNGRTL